MKNAKILVLFGHFPDYEACKMHQVQEGVASAMHNVTSDVSEAEAHGAAPEDAGGAFMFRMKTGMAGMRGNAERVFRQAGAYNRYDMKDAHEGIDKTVDGGTYDEAGLALPDEYPELERPPLRKIDKYCLAEVPCISVSKRFTQAWLVCLGFLISFGIRCNVGVATVKMTSMDTETGVPEFAWTPETVGWVDSSFFWGYIITQIPGGFLAAKFSPTMLFGAAIFCSSCLNLLLPGAMLVSPYAVMFIRVLQVQRPANVCIFERTCLRYFQTKNFPSHSSQ